MPAPDPTLTDPLIGRIWLTPRIITTSTERIESFTQAVGGRSGTTAVTFPVIVQQAAMKAFLDDPECGIDRSRLVHGEQSFHLTRLPGAGDRLTGRLEVVATGELGRHRFVTVATTITTTSGNPIAEATAVLIVRG